MPQPQVPPLSSQPLAESELPIKPTNAPVTAPFRSSSPAPKSEASHGHLSSSVEEYKMFISLVFGVSIFGASTFAVAIGQMTDPADIWKPDQPPFSIHRVRTFLGSAWLCFILAIAMAGYSSSLLTLLKRRANGVYDSNWSRRVSQIANGERPAKTSTEIEFRRLAVVFGDITGIIEASLWGTLPRGPERSTGDGRAKSEGQAGNESLDVDSNPFCAKSTVPLCLSPDLGGSTQHTRDVDEADCIVMLGAGSRGMAATRALHLQEGRAFNTLFFCAASTRRGTDVRREEFSNVQGKAVDNVFVISPLNIDM
ncbi:hypothetical protein NM208_g15697 [Fusarium decemcellulare]|uniref:Uncharacterized protein n=1 Tax=Fusarium decemcellulare TaxID=57161 RepID=A0ACC1REX5_9HYPO|nr:hypothetical protein NM208_g15697 [Fusarium decemcellulare]